MGLSCQCFVCLLLVIESLSISGRMAYGENMGPGMRLTGFESKFHPFNCTFPCKSFNFFMPQFPYYSVGGNDNKSACLIGLFRGLNGPINTCEGYGSGPDIN